MSAQHRFDTKLELPIAPSTNATAIGPEDKEVVMESLPAHLPSTLVFHPAHRRVHVAHLHLHVVLIRPGVKSNPGVALASRAWDWLPLDRVLSISPYSNIKVSVPALPKLISNNCKPAVRCEYVIGRRIVSWWSKSTIMSLYAMVADFPVAPHLDAHSTHSAARPLVCVDRYCANYAIVLVCLVYVGKVTMDVRVRWHWRSSVIRSPPGIMLPKLWFMARTVGTDWSPTKSHAHQRRQSGGCDDQDCQRLATSAAHGEYLRRRKRQIRALLLLCTFAVSMLANFCGYRIWLRSLALPESDCALAVGSSQASLVFQPQPLS